ncbi:MAG: DUF2062 domain-containing protein [Dethiobacter sp.]|jgi:uncharacterized protein (DUF2062 family)|nr:MAG: DUF2062 domain-containing protein [Dethiobacter sp.]
MLRYADRPDAPGYGIIPLDKRVGRSVRRKNNFKLKDIFLSRWRNIKKQFYSTIENQIVEIKEKPHKVALGCALGIGINFIPTLGIGFILAFFLAAFFRVNRASAAVTSLLTGPLVPLMYALNFVVGGLILAPVTGKENLLEFIIGQYSLILKVGHFQDKIFSFLELFGFTFLLGAAVNATIFSTAFFFFVSFMLNKLLTEVSSE